MYELLQFVRIDITMEKPKKTFEDRISSLGAVTVSVILYISGYAVKLSVLFSDLLSEIISNNNVRLMASTSTGIALAMGLLIVSIHEEKKVASYIIGISDSFALLLIFKIFEADSIEEYTQSFFISAFMAFVGFHLIRTFVRKYKESKSYRDKEQLKTELDQEVTELEQSKSDLEQEASETKRIVTELHQKESEANKRLQERTCPKCNQVFGSKNALNGHIGKCKAL